MFTQYFQKFLSIFPTTLNSNFLLNFKYFTVLYNFLLPILSKILVNAKVLLNPFTQYSNFTQSFHNFTLNPFKNVTQYFQ